ncbi:MAG: lipid A deacylase LpxR family protein, partial [Burkholderiales bacterium]
MSLLSCRLPLWLAAGLLASSCVFAADKCTDSKVKCEGSEFQLFIENDMLSHTDRYYTNGIKLGIGVPGDTLEELLRGFSTLALLPFPKKEELHFGWFIGQNLYTPKKISVAAPQLFDRPWAAWLYLGGVIQRADPNSLDTVEVDVGFVGPPALGDQVQTTWHRLIGASKPQGWGNQIPAQAAFVASYVHKDKFKFGAKYFELIPHVGGTVGNVFTLARAGGIVRAGINMTGFGPDSIEPGGALL